MRRTLSVLAAAACMLSALSVSAQDMSLTPLDCGTPQAPAAVNQRFSDTFAYGDLKVQFVYSCYLVKHGANETRSNPTGEEYHAIPPGTTSSTPPCF